MAKLYFRFGTMGSAKTLNLLAVAHNYQQQKKNVILLKPKMDDRFGQDYIQSRAGLKQQADALLEENTCVDSCIPKGTVCILVDEAQFLSAFVIEQLRDISTYRDIPIICYGLRTNYLGELFIGSKRLLELADTIEEIKTTCHYCHRKAIMNLLICADSGSTEGIIIGAEETFLPACYTCYDQRSKHFKRANQTIENKQA